MSDIKKMSTIVRERQTVCVITYMGSARTKQMSEFNKMETLTGGYHWGEGRERSKTEKKRGTKY